MAIFDQKNKNQISSCKFFSILGHLTLDPDPGSESGSAIRKNAGSGSVSGSALNQCGSETLDKSRILVPCPCPLIVTNFDDTILLLSMVRYSTSS
jgi:hypothetical protein